MSPSYMKYFTSNSLSPACHVDDTRQEMGERCIHGSCTTCPHISCRIKQPLPIEVQLGSNAVKLTPEGWKLGKMGARGGVHARMAEEETRVVQNSFAIAMCVLWLHHCVLMYLHSRTLVIRFTHPYLRVCVTRRPLQLPSFLSSCGYKICDLLGGVRAGYTFTSPPLYSISRIFFPSFPVHIASQNSTPVGPVLWYLPTWAASVRILSRTRVRRTT